jgi:hypothetical protein
MYTINVIISFSGDSFSIEERERLTYEEFLKEFGESTSDNLFISIQCDSEKAVNHLPEVNYHILDTRTKADLRGAHTIVTTLASGKDISDILRIKNSLEWNGLGMILRRNPKLIALILKKLEAEHISYIFGEKSVFTNHPDNLLFYFGLAFTLATMGVQDRPPKN